MENKVIYIKIKNNADIYPEGIDKRFEDSFKEASKKIYYFSPESLSYIEGELTDGEVYYFFALVYDPDKKGDKKFIKAFLGTGNYFRHNNKKKLAPHLRFTTEYIGIENTTVNSLIRLSNLDINKDFNDKYVLIEESEYLFFQIDFILHGSNTFKKTDRKYNPIESEKELHPLAQRNEYCRRQYNLRKPQNGRGSFREIMNA